MMLLSMSEWARQNHWSPEAARKLLDNQRVPQALPLKVNKNHITWAVPQGTPWPVLIDIPEGYIPLQQWLDRCGKKLGTINTHIRHGQTQGILHRFQTSKGLRIAVHRNQPWPWNTTGRPRKKQ